MSQYPTPIYEYDPDKPPRTTAIILIICGLLGIGFLAVNVFFTGEDPYQTENWIDDDGPIQGRGNILPNVWRGAGTTEEVNDSAKLAARPKPAARPTTMRGMENPFSRNPFSPPPPPTTRPIGR